jgi:methylphosphotriester-DNA--protein-cysteine methyltransferase
MLFTTDAARWAAITRRDAAADGHFIYAVKTTGIFCRPNCKARLARRANIAFFNNNEEATLAGFRACKRCKPESSTFHDAQEELTMKAVGLIKERVEEMQMNARPLRKLDLKQIAKELDWTISHFHHVFKNRMGVTPKQFAISLEKDIPLKLLDPIDGIINDDALAIKNLSEWKSLEATRRDLKDRLSDDHAMWMELEQTIEIDLANEKGLAGTGEELIDWDGFLCSSADWHDFAAEHLSA